ncbi:hypothetical protein K501DRAFT_174091, partial [Backusella circina FSU 941]
IKKGHAFVNTAEDYEEKGEWANAAAAHNQAAVQFQQATTDSQDVETRKTLSLLVNTHTRRAKDLLRKATRIQMHQEALKNIKKPESNGIQDEDLSMTKTQTIGESYALLSPENEESDPFNKFWGVVETLVDKLSNPVAFASAPLNEHDTPTNAQPTPVSEVDEEEANRITKEMSSVLESYFVISNDNMKKIIPEEEDVSTPNSASTSIEQNKQLNKRVKELKKQVYCLERKTKENTMLKSSIVQFRNDVHEQAKRIMQSQEMTGSVNGATTRRMHGSSTAEIVNRIKQLEIENQTLKTHNQKQDILVQKYKEKWEKLKEGVNRRQPSSLASDGHTPLTFNSEK